MSITKVREYFGRLLHIQNYVDNVTHRISHKMHMPCCRDIHSRLSRIIFVWVFLSFFVFHLHWDTG